MKKNTVLDLWDALSDIPTIINDEYATVIDEDFLGWTIGTNVEDIWHWFDDQFAEFGGVHTLMYDNPQPDRKFQVETPAGIIECYAKHEKDTAADFPGVYIDVRRTPKQLSGKQIGDLAACVEYDSATGHLQNVSYQMDFDDPVNIEVYEPLMTFLQFIDKYEEEIVTLDVYDEDGNEYPTDAPDPDDAIVTHISRFGNSWEITIDAPIAPVRKEERAEKIPERISKDMVRRGLADGDIEITMVENEIVAKIGPNWFYFGAQDEDITAGVHIDTTPFEDDVEAIWEAINDEPINGTTEDEAAECLFYKAFLAERFLERDAAFEGRKVEYPIEEQIANCFKYLNWENTHKNPFEMSKDELLEAKKELSECEPGIAWVAHAGYLQAVPQDKQTGFLILT